MSQIVTAAEVHALLGDVDAFVTERILSTHATADEVREAIGDIQDEYRFGDHHEPSSPRVIEVRAIVQEVVGDREWEEEVATHSST
jgi:hypothetical protein